MANNNVNLQADFHQACSTKSKDELIALQNELISTLGDFQGVFKGENLRKLREVFVTGEKVYNLDFKIAKAFREVKNVILNDSDEVVLDIALIRVLQNIVIGLKFETNEGADIIADFIECIQEVNEDVFIAEAKLQICATYITRKAQEEKTELEFSQTDNETLAGFEVRPPEHLDSAKFDADIDAVSENKEEIQVTE